MGSESPPFAGRRYRRLADELQREFGERLFKVVIDAGMTCPTRDGTLQTGGCAFCDPGGSGPGREEALSIEEQIRVRRRGRPGRFIAYLQAYSNTYCSPEWLDSILARVAAHDGVAVIAIGTRPDCVPEETLEVLSRWAEKKKIWLEYGLQSAHFHTLRAIQRGHTLAEFIDASIRTRTRKLPVVAHVILGLPGETREEMNETARTLTALRVDGVKIHMLNIVRGSKMAEAYERNEIELLDCEAYVTAVCDFLERLDPSITIHRLTGERPAWELVAPQWVLDKSRVIRLVEEELAHRDSWQGKFAKLSPLE